MAKESAISVTFHNDLGAECGVDEGPVEMRVSTAAGLIRLTQVELDRMLRAAAWHGAKQKIIDAAAIGRNTETGRSATVEDKFTAMREVYERTFRDGQWNKPRAEGTPIGGLFVQALMALRGTDLETTKGWLEKLTKDEVAALKKNPKVVAKMADLRPADPAIDSDGLLSQLG